ncbi:hypothetical protein ACHHY8_05730 [Enterobacter cloacae complex sp. 2024EL-00215]|jgi:hypothetical protein|uniref:hypothetical protein n=1 Tax=Enterobacter TaxID=547 RepID=UPI0015F3E979|nr:hypothetical protein [Enterobacter sp. RHBSTW-00901]MBA7855408.1 hypothetical protein [Enterobacter sp. RHBSTW-00901]
MKIKNLNNTTGKVCSCDSWLKHWENISGQESSSCGNQDCFNMAEVGGHVKKCDEDDNSHYIVPLCKTCNSSSNVDEFELWSRYTLVSAASTSCVKRSAA